MGSEGFYKTLCEIKGAITCGCMIPKGHKRQSLQKINLKKELRKRSQVGISTILYDCFGSLVWQCTMPIFISEYYRPTRL